MNDGITTNGQVWPSNADEKEDDGKDDNEDGNEDYFEWKNLHLFTFFVFFVFKKRLNLSDGSVESVYLLQFFMILL